MEGEKTVCGRDLYPENGICDKSGMYREIGARCLAFAAVLLLVLAPGLPAMAAQNPGQDVTINVYNWGEYIANGTDGSLDVNAEFTRRTGIKVNYTTSDSNESLYS